MHDASVDAGGAWERRDRAALGIIRGAVTVPRGLMAAAIIPEVPVETAVRDCRSP